MGTYVSSEDLIQMPLISVYTVGQEFLMQNTVKWTHPNDKDGQVH